jgi:hypothetical protein
MRINGGPINGGVLNGSGGRRWVLHVVLAACWTRAWRRRLIYRTLRGAWVKARSWRRYWIDRWIATVKPVRIRAQDEKVTRIVNERERG